MSLHSPCPIKSSVKCHQRLSIRPSGLKIHGRTRSVAFFPKLNNPLPSAADPQILDLSGKLDENPQLLEQQMTCTLSVLDLSNNKGIPIDFLWNFDFANLQTLRISHCGIEKLPDKKPFFADSLHMFSLESNDLESLPDWIFDMKELTELILFGNKFTKIRFGKNKYTIRLINLAYNPLESFEADDDFLVQVLNLSATLLDRINGFNIKSLRSLSMSRCKLKGIIDGKMPEMISTLDLSYNQIQGFTDDFFMDVKMMSMLNLAHNEINKLPEFPENYNISRINLSENLLTEIPNSLFVSRKLEYLNLSSNKIERLQPFQFSQLRDLNISFNKLKELPDSFDHLFFLSSLNASFNELTDLPKSMTSCRRLLDLYLSSNKMIHIPKVIMSFATLRSLVMCKNQLTTIPESIGALFHLKTLDFSNNNIHSFPKIIQHYKELRHLSLSHNRISEFETLEFSDKFQTLDLSFNKLKALPNFIIPSLANLSVQYNYLTSCPSLESFPLIKFYSVACNKISNKEFLIPQTVDASLELFGNEIKPIETPPQAHYIDVFTLDDYGVGIASTLGNRQSMEDSYAITFSNESSLFMIFDGHAGYNSSRAASSYIFSNMNLIDNSDDTPSAILNMIRDANDYIFENQIVDGTTCAGALIKDGTCYVTGIGDSRIIRVLKSSVEQITVDNKSIYPSEFNRLKNNGFYVSSDCRINRKLAVSRALGDFWCSDGELFVEPEIDYFEISEDDVGLVIACDGLWDVIPNEIAGEVLRNSKSAIDASITLKNLAFANGSQDNITIITVIFRPTNSYKGLHYENTVEEIPDYQESNESQLFLSSSTCSHPPTPPQRRRRR